LFFQFKIFIWGKKIRNREFLFGAKKSGIVNFYLGQKIQE